MSREPSLPVTLIDATENDIHCDLPSGRQLAIRIDGDREQLVLVGLDGAVELQVVLTEDGPVLRMPTARVELAGADELHLAARRLHLQGEESVKVSSGGTVEVDSVGETNFTAEDDMHLKGKIIYLN
jgi:hypothetical protein